MKYSEIASRKNNYNYPQMFKQIFIRILINYIGRLTF